MEAWYIGQMLGLECCRHRDGQQLEQAEIGVLLERAATQSGEVAAVTGDTAELVR